MAEQDISKKITDAVREAERPMRVTIIRTALDNAAERLEFAAELMGAEGFAADSKHWQQVATSIRKAVDSYQA